MGACHLTETEVMTKHAIRGPDTGLTNYTSWQRKSDSILLKEEILELIPGISLIKTGGHSPGHMVVKIESNGQAGYFMGDLVPYRVPSESLLHETGRPGSHSVQKSQNHSILRQALKENAVMFFYHSLYKKSGQLSLDEKKTIRAEGNLTSLASECPSSDESASSDEFLGEALSSADEWNESN
jgi:glyoxylase-like metal-dependent hydrolase (beta-lactamase superfamily II)